MRVAAVVAISAIGIIFTRCAPRVHFPRVEASSQHVQDASIVPPERLLSELRNLYDRGFDQVIGSLIEGDSAINRPLFELRRFRDESVGWAELRGSAFYALEDGYRSGGWLVVVPPGHDLLSRMQSTLQLDPNPQLNVILIKPERVTELWAGLFLIHELSHLADRALGAESPEPDVEEYLMGELRAFGLEMMAANGVTRGDFYRRLDRVLDEWQAGSVEEFVHRVRSMTVADVEKISAPVLSELAASDAEHRLRNGFYSAALLIRYAERNRLPDDELTRGLGLLMRGALSH